MIKDSLLMHSAVAVGRTMGLRDAMNTILAADLENLLGQGFHDDLSGTVRPWAGIAFWLLCCVIYITHIVFDGLLPRRRKPSAGEFGHLRN